MATSELLRVLIVDDCADDGWMIERALQRSGFRTRCLRVGTRATVAESLTSLEDWDVVLCDPAASALDAEEHLARAHAAFPRVPIVLVSGRREHELGGLLSRGAVSGYVSKEHLDDVPAVVRALVPWRSRRGTARRGTDLELAARPPAS